LADGPTSTNRTPKRSATDFGSIVLSEPRVLLKESFGNGETSSQDDLLLIEDEITNLSPSKKLDYRGWNGADFVFGRDFASLKDNFDNSYKRINFGFSTQVVGQVKSESIYPGKSQRDVLVFEKPVPNVEYLNLELPAGNFRGGRNASSANSLFNGSMSGRGN
jgi:hypothetical protein